MTASLVPAINGKSLNAYMFNFQACLYLNHLLGDKLLTTNLAITHQTVLDPVSSASSIPNDPKYNLLVNQTSFLFPYISNMTGSSK
jgi:hypothetical protein